MLAGRTGAAVLGAALLTLLAVTGCSSSRLPRSSTSPTVTAPKSVAATSTSSTTPATPVVIDHGPRTRHAVALTFDSNLTTFMIRELDRHEVSSFDNTAVIDELDREQVPATFFLSGLWMERYPDTVRRLAGDPLFELGSHSYAHIAFTTHCYGLGTLPVSAMAADVERSEAVLAQFAPHATRYFRFPGGCFDEQALRAIAPSGVTVIGYDVASGDAFGRSRAAIVSNVLGHVRDGSIVVLHITGGNTAPLTADAVPDIIRGLRQRGFELDRVSDLLDAR